MSTCQRRKSLAIITFEFIFHSSIFSDIRFLFVIVSSLRLSYKIPSILHKKRTNVLSLAKHKAFHFPSPTMTQREHDDVVGGLFYRFHDSLVHIFTTYSVLHVYSEEVNGISDQSLACMQKAFSIVFKYFLITCKEFCVV